VHPRWSRAVVAGGGKKETPRAGLFALMLAAGIIQPASVMRARVSVRAGNNKRFSLP